MNGLLCEQLSPPTSNSLIYSVYCKNHLNKSVNNLFKLINNYRIEIISNVYLFSLNQTYVYCQHLICIHLIVIIIKK
jgi:hypothetical protein